MGPERCWTWALQTAQIVAAFRLGAGTVQSGSLTGEQLMRLESPAALDECGAGRDSDADQEHGWDGGVEWRESTWSAVDAG
jgi:hypothetical protein